MFQKLILILLFSCCFQVKSQNSQNIEEDENNSISNQLYTKCFENLNQGSEILEKYPAFKNAKICSIMYCSALLSYEEEDLKLVAEERMRGIATQLFREGTPVLLITGMESYERAQKNNENLEDDNHIIYISIAACTVSQFEARAREIINKQTKTLINNNSLKY